MSSVAHLLPPTTALFEGLRAHAHTHTYILMYICICMQLLHAEENHGYVLCAWANVPHTATRRLATSEACGVRQMWQATRR